MTSSTSLKLALRLIQRPKKRRGNAFTLVELMVVVAIVGILSAVALPNFLSQTDKAKATEAKSNLASTLKQAHAKFLEDGKAPDKAKLTTDYGTPADKKTKFNYAEASFDAKTNIWEVEATGNDNDSGLKGKKLRGCINFETGKIDIGSKLDTTAETVTCT